MHPYTTASKCGPRTRPRPLPLPLSPLLVFVVGLSSILWAIASLPAPAAAVWVGRAVFDAGGLSSYWTLDSGSMAPFTFSGTERSHFAEKYFRYTDPAIPLAEDGRCIGYGNSGDGSGDNDGEDGSNQGSGVQSSIELIEVPQLESDGQELYVYEATAGKWTLKYFEHVNAVDQSLPWNVMGYAADQRLYNDGSFQVTRTISSPVQGEAIQETVLVLEPISFRILFLYIDPLGPTTQQTNVASALGEGVIRFAIPELMQLIDPDGTGYATFNATGIGLKTGDFSNCWKAVSFDFKIGTFIPEQVGKFPTAADIVGAENVPSVKQLQDKVTLGKNMGISGRWIAAGSVIVSVLTSLLLSFHMASHAVGITTSTTPSFSSTIHTAAHTLQTAALVASLVFTPVPRPPIMTAFLGELKTFILRVNLPWQSPPEPQSFPLPTPYVDRAGAVQAVQQVPKAWSWDWFARQTELGSQAITTYDTSTSYVAGSAFWQGIALTSFFLIYAGLLVVAVVSNLWHVDPFVHLTMVRIYVILLSFLFEAAVLNPTFYLRESDLGLVVKESWATALAALLLAGAAIALILHLIVITLVIKFLDDPTRDIFHHKNEGIKFYSCLQGHWSGNDKVRRRFAPIFDVFCGKWTVVAFLEYLMLFIFCVLITTLTDDSKNAIVTTSILLAFTILLLFTNFDLLIDKVFLVMEYLLLTLAGVCQIAFAYISEASEQSQGHRDAIDKAAASLALAAIILMALGNFISIAITIQDYLRKNKAWKLHQDHSASMDDNDLEREKKAAAQDSFLEANDDVEQQKFIENAQNLDPDVVDIKTRPDDHQAHHDDMQTWQSGPTLQQPDHIEEAQDPHYYKHTELLPPPSVDQQ